MEKVENIEDFYRNQLNWMPDDLKNGIGHFNIFKIDDFRNSKNKPINYSRRDYFKITLLKGRVRIHYADKSVESDKYALLFSDPLIPYSWEPLDGKQSGSFCIFTEAFFYNHGVLRDYPVFQPNQNKLFLLNDENLADVEAIYAKMFKEISSDYIYKYDVLRNLAFELIHYALKIEPASAIVSKELGQSTKIASLFTELLERQFPIQSPYQRIKVKSPSEFAKNLNIHTNHLNRTLKYITGQTTSELISKRISQEAKVLLKHTDWSIADISFALGYDEPPHFINFFKKRFDQTPKRYRNELNV
ncbi:MAG: helix-turn-helix transcriptional regulator [Sulfurospirillaceae bacterium]|nr:helix-turn-helix transcriptional regulator [Sulfurospirillaceae bacterium]